MIKLKTIDSVAVLPVSLRSRSELREAATAGQRKRAEYATYANQMSWEGMQSETQDLPTFAGSVACA